MIETKNCQGAVNATVIYATADFTTTVKKLEGIILETVKVTDAVTPGCDPSVGNLTPEARSTYPCESEAVKRKRAGVTVATGTSPSDARVHADTRANVRAANKAPGTSGAELTGLDEFAIGRRRSSSVGVPLTGWSGGTRRPLRGEGRQAFVEFGLVILIILGKLLGMVFFRRIYNK